MGQKFITLNQAQQGTGEKEEFFSFPPFAPPPPPAPKKNAWSLGRKNRLTVD